MSQSHFPLAEKPVINSAAPEPPQDRKRAFTFCASSFGVVRLEDVHEIANLKADLVACYRPVNSQEMFALERMAIAQQLILRAARLDAGLFTSAMNEVLNLDHNPIVTMDPDMIGDIEVTRQQNRNFCIAEGFRRIAKESDLMNLALRYRIQAERDYRRALEEFQRLERLRPKLPNEPILLADPDGKGDIVAAWELNPWIPKTAPNPEPVGNNAPVKQPVVPPAPAPEALIVSTPPPPTGNVPVAAWSRRETRQEPLSATSTGTSRFSAAATSVNLLPWASWRATEPDQSLTRHPSKPRPAKASLTNGRPANCKRSSASKCRSAFSSAPVSPIVSP